MVRPEIDLCFLPNILFQTVIPAIPNMTEVARRNTLALQLSSGAHHHHHLAGLGAQDAGLGAQDVVQGAHQQTGLLVDQLGGPGAPTLRDAVAVAIQGARQQLVDYLAGPGAPPLHHQRVSPPHVRVDLQLGQPQVPVNDLAAVRVHVPGGSGVHVPRGSGVGGPGTLRYSFEFICMECFVRLHCKTVSFLVA